MTPNDGRLVWITREQRDWLNDFGESKYRVQHDLVAAWDAAPSNPVERLAAVFGWERAQRVVRALGVSSPHAANTDTT